MSISFMNPRAGQMIPDDNTLRRRLDAFPIRGSCLLVPGDVTCASVITFHGVGQTGTGTRNVATSDRTTIHSLSPLAPALMHPW